MIEAVSAVLIFKEEIFLIKRQSNLSAFPGYCAFPGGKVDKEEELVVALYRELEEELDISISKVRDEMVIEECYLGPAITPKFSPHRFTNHFFKIVLNVKPNFKLESSEIELGYWITPKDYIKKFKEGASLIVPPVLRLIEELANDISIAECPNLNRYSDDSEEVPLVESLFGVKQFIPLSNTFPPISRTNSFLIGDNVNRCLIDPSPKDKEECERFLIALKDYEVDTVFITHSHPDHYEFAPTIAKKLRASISLSKDTLKRIKDREGSGYFKDLDIVLMKEGDVLTESLSKKVLVYEIPGHDSGHLGLASEDMNWFLVGDLIQGAGTVVVGGAEGDMGEYFKSLRRVIDLAPKNILPSHGIITGGVNQLVETLNHRLVRELQVKALLAKGHTPKEMLDIIYEDLDENLQKYALMNIISHINKLKCLEDE